MPWLTDAQIQALTYKSGRINRVGVELEGGWRDWPPNMEGDIHGDGSVSVHSAGVRHVGELVSAPMPPVDLPRWMEKHYPHAANETCGLHVHMSFRTALTYQRLMSTDYFEYILKQLNDWGRATPAVNSTTPWFYSRLRGDNTYCRREYRADAQAASRYKDSVRYAALNYCYTLHKTLEVRVLPMFPDMSVGIPAVVELMLKTNQFLDALPPEQPHVTTLEGDGGVLLEVKEVL